MATDRKEYMRQLMAKKRAAAKVEKTQEKPEKVEKQAIDLAMFEGKGRGVPVNGYVLVSGGNRADDYVVTESVWRKRMGARCIHLVAGWQCKKCVAAWSKAASG